MKRLPLSLIVVAGVAAGVALVLTARPHASPVARKTAPLPVPAVRNVPALKEFVAAHASERSPVSRDRVGTAELRLGYAIARKEGFARARTAFLRTAKAHDGVGTQSAALSPTRRPTRPCAASRARARRTRPVEASRPT